jgi:hypothetical protein
MSYRCAQRDWLVRHKGSRKLPVRRRREIACMGVAAAVKARLEKFGMPAQRPVDESSKT